MLKRLVLVAGILVAVAVVAAGPMGVNLFTGSAVAASKCNKCKHDKCPGDCAKCPDCQKK